MEKTEEKICTNEIEKDAEQQLRRAYTNYIYTEEQSKEGNSYAKRVLHDYKTQFKTTREHYKAVKKLVKGKDEYVEDRSKLVEAESNLRQAYTNYTFTKEQAESGNYLANKFLQEYRTKFLSAREHYKAVEKLLSIGFYNIQK